MGDVINQNGFVRRLMNDVCAYRLVGLKTERPLNTMSTTLKRTCDGFMKAR